MADQEQAALRLQLARLRQEHADFDAAVNAMETVGCDRLQIQRMKKKKLTIRDRLQDLEDQIIPDISA
ncbi:YdcH family protein [Aurantimonas sp. A2-1-M11]|uniref:YdcH family protein n=1 Tax=Aurantimonas sp. A2-1-M11 TaxID=3113712 RepID=UPI002F91FF70